MADKAAKQPESQLGWKAAEMMDDHDPFFDMPILERIAEAVRRVRQGLEQSTSALTAERVPFALIGAQAVSAWIRNKDESLERTTPNTDLLIQRDDLERASQVLIDHGFIRSGDTGRIFLTRSTQKERSAVRLWFADERVRAANIYPHPMVSDVVTLEGMPVLALEPLVQIKLDAWRLVDKVQLHDLATAKLIDRSWGERFCPVLVARLHEFFETTEIIDHDAINAELIGWLTQAYSEA